jgi:two-component system, chemotaxis family, CheB/CheR fusion protein
VVNVNASEDGQQRELEELLLMMKTTRGFDFTGYKRSTLMRRVARRMGAVGIASVGEYRDLLEVQPQEYALLFDSLLINVTGFFRDSLAWDSLREDVLPRILENKPHPLPIRIWSAGCSSGQEAYTLAIVLAEALGVERFRERVKIYATDLDEDALQKARSGVYSEKDLSNVPEELRDRYFERLDTSYVFRRDLRRQVIFGRNDLTRDAPISRVDLLVIRNTLMYFNAETQATILRRLHFALADHGYIFLGKAEMLINHGDWFEPVDLRKRLFRKLPGSVPVARRPPIEDAGGRAVQISQIRAAALSTAPTAQLALDAEDNLVIANAKADAMFGLHPMDVGRPFHDLDVSYRPVELRSVIHQVKTEQRPVELSGVQWQRPGNGEVTVLDIAVTPLFGPQNRPIGVSLSFNDVTRYSRLHDELEHANEELERAYQELQSLNEELETTNEELQSTNEELETTNEELQSTNEELETMNEELQSTNDELQEINDTLRKRTDELDTANAFLATVLESLGSAVIVVDGNLRVTVWSPGAEEMWGVRAEETRGQHLLTLDIGLPVTEVVPLVTERLRDPAAGRQETTIKGFNRRGRAVELRLESSLLQDAGVVRGVILVANYADA